MVYPIHLLANGDICGEHSVYMCVYQGAWTGPAVQSEFVAAVVALLVWYMAYSARAKLQQTS